MALPLPAALCLLPWLLPAPLLPWPVHSSLLPFPPPTRQVKMVGGLDGKIDAANGGWSLGQMQLMCLARAALKKVPILCLDEATAAMDPHTEAHVLEIIERLFSDRTTLTIAHRCAAALALAPCLGLGSLSGCVLGCCPALLCL